MGAGLGHCFYGRNQLADNAVQEIGKLLIFPVTQNPLVNDGLVKVFL